MSRYTVFLTYNFSAKPYQAGVSLGYGESIHCNYIQSFETDDIQQKDISFYFEKAEYFKFLYDGNGTALFSVNYIYAIVQIVDNETFGENETITPDNTKWKKINVSDQIDGYNPNGNETLTPEQLGSTVFKISYNSYIAASNYNLNYLDYPLSAETDDPKLSFGEESFFFGNVNTDIEAIAYTTDISINLRMGDFNSTTNPTWNGESDLYITEVGIYDDNNNLVGIGKLTNPISKSQSIGRTIVFALDF